MSNSADGSVPNIIEAIPDGRQPEGVTLPGLLEPFAVEWIQQTGCPPKNSLLRTIL
jgi:hypothetical protein